MSVQACNFICVERKTKVSPWSVQHNAPLGFVYQVEKTWGNEHHQYNVTAGGSGTRLHVSKY